MVISARLVLVTIIKRVVLAVPVWFVEMENEKHLLVLQQLIVFVLKTIVLVRMVFKLLELLVLHIMLISARLAPVTIIKRAVHVVSVLLAVLAKDKQLLVLQQLIVYVLKMIVLVKTVLKQLERLVLHTIVTPARLVQMVTILVIHRVWLMVAPVTTD